MHRTLAAQLGGSQPLVDAIGAAAAKLAGPSLLSTSSLYCLLSAAEALVDLPPEVSDWQPEPRAERV